MVVTDAHLEMSHPLAAIFFISRCGHPSPQDSLLWEDMRPKAAAIAECQSESNTIGKITVKPT